MANPWAPGHATHGRIFVFFYALLLCFAFLFYFLIWFIYAFGLTLVASRLFQHHPLD